jgi:hypothetical protein
MVTQVEEEEDGDMCGGEARGGREPSGAEDVGQSGDEPDGGIMRNNYQPLDEVQGTERMMH